jgi:hypothetical protein
MSTHHYRLRVERLEHRNLLSANVWFQDSGQSLSANHDTVELGDLDGDGDLDAFLACRSLAVPPCSETEVWLNDGKGLFSKYWSDSKRGIDEVGLGDFDSDGDLDAFFTRIAPDNHQPNEVWLNDGNGAFVDSGQRLRNFGRAVGIGDVDGDGDLDAVTGSPGYPGIVWLNDGAGVFTDNGQRLADWAFRVAIGDVDGDRDLDAWFGRGTDSPNPQDRLFLNDGQGNFTDSGQTLNTVSTGDVAFGDLDGDGDLDAYLANGHQRGGNIPDRVWMNDGTGKFTDSGQRLGRSNGRSVELGDIDGDGDLDAVVGNGTTLGSIAKQPNVIWLNDGKGVFTAGQEIGNAATTSVELGDVDNDGDLDAFFSNLGDGNQLWLNTRPIAGDANRDGVFNSSDLVVVFKAGEYEDGIAGNSTWEEGDWSGDGEFDTADLVLAFTDGRYSQAAVSSMLNAESHVDSYVIKRRSRNGIEDLTLPAQYIDHVFDDASRLRPVRQ